MNEYKIILADDHEVLLDGLVAIINAEDNLRVAGTARNGNDLLNKVRLHQPDLCIVDLDMPVMNGLDASGLILKQYEDIRIIILTMHKESSLLKKIKDAGIHGYLLKTCDSEELIFAVNKVLKGQRYYTGLLFSEPSAEEQTSGSDLGKISLLTRRELEIVKLLCQGYSNTKIAAELCISPSTVDNHRTNIMRKLDVHNIAGLIRFCISNNVV